MFFTDEGKYAVARVVKCVGGDAIPGRKRGGPVQIAGQCWPHSLSANIHEVLDSITKQAERTLRKI